MAIDLETLGGGAGTGFLVSLVTAFGFGRRVSRVEDNKQDKSVCDALHRDSDRRLERIEEKLDGLNDYLRNHK